MKQGWSAWRQRLGNRLAIRLSARARPAGGFKLEPEPRSIGYFARGKQLAAGNFLLGGHMVESRTPFDVEPPSPGFAAELHGFGWLDHMAAVGDRDARMAAQGWVGEWIARFGQGAGPGWQPELAGRRLTRDGVIVISAQRFRDQPRNREDALVRLVAILREAAEPPVPRRPTRPTLASKQRRVEGKVRRARTKALRGRPMDD